MHAPRERASMTSASRSCAGWLKAASTAASSGRGADLPAAVGAPDHIGVEQRRQRLHITVGARGGERGNQFGLLGGGGREPRPALFDVAAGPGRELAHRRHRPAGDVSDLGEGQRETHQFLAATRVAVSAVVSYAARSASVYTPGAGV